jgi:N-acetylated-alpha-linked acidic dipeptidase
MDPREPVKAPVRGAPAPHLNFAALENAADSLARAAARFERAYASASGGGRVDRELAVRVNGMLRDTERTLTAPDGLPKRPWYRHLLYAPGLYTGYGVKTMPAAREAIEQREWTEAEREMARIAQALTRAAAHVSSIAELLEGR